MVPRNNGRLDADTDANPDRDPNEHEDASRGRSAYNSSFAGLLQHTHTGRGNKCATAYNPAANKYTVRAVEDSTTHDPTTDEYTEEALIPIR